MKTSLFGLFTLAFCFLIQYNLSAQSFNQAVGIGIDQFKYQLTTYRPKVQSVDKINSLNFTFNPNLSFDLDSVASVQWSSYMNFLLYNGESSFSKVDIPLVFEIHIGNHDKFQVFAGGGITTSLSSSWSDAKENFGTQLGCGMEFNCQKQRGKLRYSYSKSMLPGRTFENHAGDFKTTNAISALIFLSYQ